MEEYFADGPLTPEQYEEDQTLYESHLPFIDRILIAIQRFERTRKLTPERRDIFYKWLAYGGVDVSPNMFQSKDSLDTSNMTKAELAVAMSQVSIGTDKHNTDSPDALYAVDFLGCMKGFLSRRAILVWGLDSREKTVEVTTTLERFMDYLLQHDVCPEYSNEVTATRNFCRVATEELCATAEAGRRLPGDFNIACSTIFGGQYAEGYDGETSWAPSTAGQVSFVGFTQEMAKQIINFAIAGQAPEAVYQKHMDLLTTASLTVEMTKEHAGFEITRIEPPTSDTLDIYRTSAREFRPVGTVHAKPWHNPELPPVDSTPDERAAAEKEAHTNPSPPSEEYIFLIEQAILLNLRVGMKLEATLKKLTSGIWYFDEFLTVYPSFDTYLCNEMMVDYKAPRWLAGSVPFEEQDERERAEEAARKRKEEEREGAFRAAMKEAEAEGEAEAEADGCETVANVLDAGDADSAKS